MADIRVEGTEMVSMNKVNASELEDLGFTIERNSTNTMCQISGSMFISAKSSFDYVKGEIKALKGVESAKIVGDDIVVSFLEGRK